jgi:hypothetical protein
VTEIVGFWKKHICPDLRLYDVALSSEIIACESSSKDLNNKVASASTFEDVSNDVVGSRSTE